MQGAWASLACMDAMLSPWHYAEGTCGGGLIVVSTIAIQSSALTIEERPVPGLVVKVQNRRPGWALEI